MKKNRVDYVTLHFPLLHIDTTERLQYDKVVEEYNQLRKELFSESGPDKMLHELQDIVQAYLTLLCVKVKPYAVDEQEAAEKVSDLVFDANQKHRKRMERLKADRGWL